MHLYATVATFGVYIKQTISVNGMPSVFLPDQPLQGSCLGFVSFLAHFSLLNNIVCFTVIALSLQIKGGRRKKSGSGA